jgi:cell division protein FtsB
MAKPPAQKQLDSTSTPSAASRLLVWFSLGALLLSLPLMVNIVGRAQAQARLQAEVNRVAQTIQTDEAKLKGLNNALAHAKSDAFVEEWARVRARWGKDGEVVIVPPASGEVARLWWEDFIK